MSIDSLVRRISQETRDDVDGSLDVEARLAELHVVRRRRRVVKGTAGLVAAAAVGAVTLGVLSSGQGDEVQPAGQGRSLQVKEACPESDAIECLDGATILVRAKTPYTFTLTPGMSRDVGVSAAPEGVDVYADGQENGGVTILTGVEAADGDVVGAEALARWVAARGFLQSTPVTRGTLDGLQTWSVEVRLAKSGAGVAGVCNVMQSSCRPLLEQPARSHWQTGMWDGMVNRYTFLDVQGLGTVAVSSWVFQDPGVPYTDVRTALARHDLLVRSIDFQVP